MFLKLFNFKPKPFNQGFINVGDGHELYFHEYGNPNGVSVICFHGGPGYYPDLADITPFNLRKYRITLFDQRGCGKSRYTDLLKNNTPAYTVSDSEKVLEYLNIDKVIAYSVSYGATLAILFAEKNPSRIIRIVLSRAYIYLNKKDDFGRKWWYETSGLFYPEFQAEIKPPQYYIDNPSEFLKIYQYESIIGSLDPKWKVIDESERANAIRRITIFLHYEANGYFTEDGQIMRDIKKIRKIPTLMVHNRLDMDSPVKQAWLLANALDNAKLYINPSMTHSGRGLRKLLKTKLSEIQDD